MSNTITITLTVDQFELAMIATRRLSPNWYEHQRKGNPHAADFIAHLTELNHRLAQQLQLVPQSAR